MKSVTYGQTIKQASFQVLPASGFHTIKGGVHSGHSQSWGGREGKEKRGNSARTSARLARPDRADSFSSPERME